MSERRNFASVTNAKKRKRKDKGRAILNANLGTSKIVYFNKFIASGSATNWRGKVELKNNHCVHV